MFSIKSLLIIFVVSIASSQAILTNFTLSCEVLSDCEDKNVCEVLCIIPKDFNDDDELSVENVEFSEEIDENGGFDVVLHENEMTMTIPRGLGEKFPKMSSLKITSSTLATIKRVDFNSMSNLKVLNLASNQISTIPADTFHSLTALESLWLNDNKIEHLPHNLLYPLVNLRDFYAEFNKIERLESNFFHHNEKLERIYLQNNNLIRINENFQKLTALTFVDLRNNADFCRVCKVMSSEESKRRFDACEREKFESDVKTKTEYGNCVWVKIGEKDEIKSQLEECFIARADVNESLMKNFTLCVDKILPNPTSLRTFDTCLFHKISNEFQLQNRFENCIASRATKSDKITAALQNCYGKRDEMAKLTAKVYGNCKFCQKIELDGSVAKCELRFVRDYGDNLNQFQHDVNKFFKV